MLWLADLPAVPIAPLLFVFTHLLYHLLFPLLYSIVEPILDFYFLHLTPYLLGTTKMSLLPDFETPWPSLGCPQISPLVHLLLFQVNQILSSFILIPQDSPVASTVS